MLNKQGYPSGIMTSPPSLFLKMTLLTGYLDNLKKKNPSSESRVIRTLHIWTHHTPFGVNNDLFRKTSNITFMCHCAPSKKPLEKI